MRENKPCLGLDCPEEGEGHTHTPSDNIFHMRGCGCKFLPNRNVCIFADAHRCWLDKASNFIHKNVRSILCSPHDKHYTVEKTCLISKVKAENCNRHVWFTRTGNFLAYSPLRRAAPQSCPPQTWAGQLAPRAGPLLSPSSAESFPAQNRHVRNYDNFLEQLWYDCGQRNPCHSRSNTSALLTFFSWMFPHSSSWNEDNKLVHLLLKTT